MEKRIVISNKNVHIIALLEKMSVRREELKRKMEARVRKMLL